MAKTYTPLMRPPLISHDHEKWMRGILEDALKDHPLYGHRLCTRARKIHIEMTMDALYLDWEGCKRIEREDPEAAEWLYSRDDSTEHKRNEVFASAMQGHSVYGRFRKEFLLE